MSIRIGMPSGGRLCLAGSGLLLSRPPGVFSQATTPHMLPLHCATRTLPTPSPPRQSPVGSAARAEEIPAANNTAEYAIVVDMRYLRRCNIGRKPVLAWMV